MTPPRRARVSRLALAAVLGLLPGVACAQESDRPRLDAAAEAIADRLGEIRASLSPRPGGVLGLLGYNIVPDGSTNALQINRSSVPGGGEGDPTLTLGQLGSGFTVSSSLPLFLEGYIGWARYDPRAVIAGAEGRGLPFRWNNLAVTIGVGYDIQLTDYLWLRPIFNAAFGYATSDVTLFGNFLRFRTGIDIEPLRKGQVLAYGLGGALVLAYYDYRPARDIDLELRYTEIHLQSFGNTLEVAAGSAVARTLGLWTRYRWPMGVEAFTRPVRWVLEGSGSYYLGDQRDALGFDWSVKVGGGIEVDIGRHEIGAVGLYVSRVRLVGRYFYGDGGVTGVSFGLGVSF